MIKARRLSDVDYVAELGARSLFLTRSTKGSAQEGRWMSRPKTEAGLGGRKSTGDEQDQNAMRGKVGKDREDGVATVAKHKVEGDRMQALGASGREDLLLVLSAAS